MYPRLSPDALNPYFRRRSISSSRFPSSQDTLFHRTYSLRKDPRKEPLYDEVYEKLLVSRVQLPAGNPGLEGKKIVVDEWDARSPLNSGTKQILYPRLISTDGEEWSTPKRSFSIRSLRHKNTAKAPNLRRVSFSSYPTIIGERNEERVKNLEAIILKMAPKNDREALKQAVEGTLSPVGPKNEKKKGGFSNFLKQLLPWTSYKQQKKAKKMREEEEALQMERAECIKFLASKKAAAGRVGPEWQEKNDAVVEELKKSGVVHP